MQATLEHPPQVSGSVRAVAERLPQGLVQIIHAGEEIPEALGRDPFGVRAVVRRPAGFGRERVPVQFTLPSALLRHLTT